LQVFQFLRELFAAIFIKNCTKCKSVTKKRYYKTISVCMKKSVIYDETVDLQARSFTTPANSALIFRDFVPR